MQVVTESTQCMIMVLGSDRDRARVLTCHVLPAIAADNVAWGECGSSVQVVMESRRECQEAQKLLGMIKMAFPEVLTAIKTKQLAQEILLNKEEHIGEVAKTGMPWLPNCLQRTSSVLQVVAAVGKQSDQEYALQSYACL